MYRVGRHCFATIEAATDYQMSLVVPTVTADGSLVHPVKQGDTWTHAGQPVHLSFGTCDPQADLAAGMQVAGIIIMLFAVAWSFRFLMRFIQTLPERGNESD
ncbi:hypothetical protein [Paralysiella testudinis]|uniref:Uncharacterized protein n=1 Tax=Paralysiella testudinis TaxID=2809020 RepID=A0A892ZGM8_9NEIS|nr:hypothetical protein [Paralysiella testudinis]QRQ81793.1 hypothetical protein JQU52_14175 [Paralysiella testudinis]